ncbi:MAG: hypothetical protein WB930_00905 [Syntrophobacteraceae bacterium]
MGIKEKCSAIEVNEDLVLIAKSGVHDELLYGDEERCFRKGDMSEVGFQGTFELWKRV